MGRPSLKTQRREDILQAFCDCLADKGLEGTTLDAIAEKAGVQRAAIRHFVGNRDQLVRDGLEYLSERYSESLSTEFAMKPGPDRLKRLLKQIFIGAHAQGHSKEDSALNNLFAAAAADTSIRTRLRDMYVTFESKISDEIMSAHPEVTKATARKTAYAILCLVEHNGTMRWLGFPKDRAVGAMKSAEALIDAAVTTHHH